MDTHPQPAISRTYTASERTQEQRRINANTRHFNGFVKVLQSKLRLHLDDVARTHEVASMIRHTFTFEQMCELYADEAEAFRSSSTKAIKEELDLEYKDKYLRCRVCYTRLALTLDLVNGSIP